MSDAFTLRCPSCGSRYIAGTVTCADCLATDLQPMAPGSIPPTGQSPWHPTKGLQTALTVLFVLTAVGSSISALVHAHRNTVIDRIKDGTATMSQAQRADDFVRATSLALLSLFVTTAIVFIVWQWSTAKNAGSLGRTAARYGPGWSIGSWFIPLANLVMPVQIMQDLWRSTDPRSSADDWRNGPRSVLVGWWWGAFLVASLISRTISEHGSSLAALQAADTRASLSAVVAAIAAILAIGVVRRITARQAALRDSLREAGSGIMPA
jgi:Domain of unknown function (DUF4328)